MTTDVAPLKQCDHVVFVDEHRKSHDAIVTLIVSDDIIDLIYLTIDPDGAPRLHTKTGIVHKTATVETAPYWWISEYVDMIKLMRSKIHDQQKRACRMKDMPPSDKYATGYRSATASILAMTFKVCKDDPS